MLQLSARKLGKHTLTLLTAPSSASPGSSWSLGGPYFCSVRLSGNGYDVASKEPWGRISSSWRPGCQAFFPPLIDTVLTFEPGK